MAVVGAHRAKAAAEEMRKEETTRKQAAEQEAAVAAERESEVDPNYWTVGGLV
jgi:hypothetical protein